MTNRQSRDSETSFDGILSVDTVPPPPGEPGDVHSARTTVAALPDSFLEQLKTGKAEEPTTARYRVLADRDVLPAVETPVPPARVHTSAPVPPPLPVAARPMPEAPWWRLGWPSRMEALGFVVVIGTFGAALTLWWIAMLLAR